MEQRRAGSPRRLGKLNVVSAHSDVDQVPVAVDDRIEVACAMSLLNPARLSDTLTASTSGRPCDPKSEMAANRSRSASTEHGFESSRTTTSVRTAASRATDSTAPMAFVCALVTPPLSDRSAGGLRWCQTGGVTPVTLRQTYIA